MFDTVHLTNMLRSEVEGIPETGLPLDDFPDKIQEIILNLARYENFNVEYTASIVLSAVASVYCSFCCCYCNRQLLSYPYKGRVENLPIPLYDVGRTSRARKDSSPRFYL